MKLLVDIGNSRVKWAFYEAGTFVVQGDARHDDEAGLRPLLAFGEAPDEIRLANVAGTAAGASIAARLRERFHIPPVFAGSATTGAGVVNGYVDAGQLGVDRWLGICAAYARYGGPVCVVDAGTATTIDMVTGTGQHQGGLIIPGMELMQAALLRGTGDLARLASGGPVKPALNTVAQPLLLGRDTAAAIRYGALQATVSVVRACTDGLGADVAAGKVAHRLVLTGGAGPALLQELHRAPPAHWSRAGFRVESRPNLVLEGLALEPPCFAAGS